MDFSCPDESVEFVLRSFRSKMQNYTQKLRIKDDVQITFHIEVEYDLNIIMQRVLALL